MPSLFNNQKKGGKKMACQTLIEQEEDCENNIGGTTEFLYNDQAEVTATTITSGVITAMTTTTVFKTVSFKKNAASYTESEKIDLGQGSNYIEGTVSLSLKRRDSAKSNLIRIAAQGQRKMAIIMKDGNGKFWYLQNMQLSGNEGGSGDTKAAGSKYDLTFLGEYDVLAYPVEASVVAGLLVP